MLVLLSTDTLPVLHPAERAFAEVGPLMAHTPPGSNGTGSNFNRPGDEETAAAWQRRRDVAITIFLWVVLSGMIIWLLSFIVRPLLIIAIAGLLAYAVAPAVRILRRWMPQPVAVALVYIGLISLVAGIGLLFVANLSHEIATLASQLSLLLTPGKNGLGSPLTLKLESLGLSQPAIQSMTQRLAQDAQNAAQSALPLLGSVISEVAAGLVGMMLVLMLSLYFLIDGPRLAGWMRRNVPVRQRPRLTATLETVPRVLGGYIRGQLTLSGFIGVLVGGGMAVLQVHYAVLLGLLAFLLEFIPAIGTVISGVVCVVVALTQSWQLALVVLAYFVVIHIAEGYIIAPRVMAKAVGVHPAISIIALLVGAEVLGIWGALFAAPLAGLLQVLAGALWLEWRRAHATYFPEEFGAPVVPVTTAEAFAQPSRMAESDQAGDLVNARREDDPE